MKSINGPGLVLIPVSWDEPAVGLTFHTIAFHSSQFCPFLFLSTEVFFLQDYKEEKKKNSCCEKQFGTCHKYSLTKLY